MYIIKLPKHWESLESDRVDLALRASYKFSPHAQMHKIKVFVSLSHSSGDWWVKRVVSLQCQEMLGVNSVLCRGG